MAEVIVMKTPYRPILNIPKTRVEKLIDIIGLNIFIASILFLLLNWGNIPEKVPGHFNRFGNVDRWGSKYEILILPAIGLFIYVLISLLEKAPHMHNYPIRMNKSNVQQFYLNSRINLNVIKNICLILFSFLVVQIVRVSIGKINSLGEWFLPVFLVTIFGTMIIGLYKRSKIK